MSLRSLADTQRPGVVGLSILLSVAVVASPLFESVETIVVVGTAIIVLDRFLWVLCEHVDA